MMHIAFCTDVNYMMPMGVALTSVCKNHAPGSLTIHLVVTEKESTEEELKTLFRPLLMIGDKWNNRIELYYLPVEQLDGYLCDADFPYISSTAFARIFLPDLLPASLDKVIYLDCDLIVDGSLQEMWDTELDDNHLLGAVIDGQCNSPVRRITVETPLEIPYCNSGVLLMNLKAWRKEGFVQTAVSIAKRRSFPLLDQDLLNYALRDRIQILPVKFNVQVSFYREHETRWMIPVEQFEEALEAVKHPVIVHYVGPCKPWKMASCPQKDLWRKYKAETEWRDMSEEVLANMPFADTMESAELERSYCNDRELFSLVVPEFLRFFNAALLIRHKRTVVNGLCRLLKWGRKLLHAIYAHNLKK